MLNFFFAASSSLANVFRSGIFSGAALGCARGSVRHSTGGGADDGGAYGAAAQGTATHAAAQCGAAPAAAHGAQKRGDGGARPRDGGVRLSGQRDTAARQPAVGGGGQGHGAGGQWERGGRRKREVGIRV